MIGQQPLFVTRLSRSLMVVIGIFAVLVISKQITEAPFSSANLPGVQSEEDVATLQRLNWAGRVFGIALLLFLAYSAWSLSRRRDWARRVVIGLLVFGAITGAWWGILFVLSAVGATDIPGPPNASSSFRAALHLAFGAIGAMALAFAYLCWRLIASLRSPEIRNEFRADET